MVVAIPVAKPSTHTHFPKTLKVNDPTNLEPRMALLARERTAVLGSRSSAERVPLRHRGLESAPTEYWAARSFDTRAKGRPTVLLPLCLATREPSEPNVLAPALGFKPPL